MFPVSFEVGFENGKVTFSAPISEEAITYLANVANGDGSTVEFQ